MAINPPATYREKPEGMEEAGMKVLEILDRLDGP